MIAKIFLIKDPTASDQRDAGPNIDVRSVLGVKTLHGVSNPPLRLGVHGVSKLALREKVATTFSDNKHYLGETSFCLFPLRLVLGNKTHLRDLI